MRCIVQRVSRASVQVEGTQISAISRGLLVLVGITHDDDIPQAEWMARKVMDLRIFPDNDGKMNRSVCDIHGSVLFVSQFTLYADVRKGTRPSFLDDASATQALNVIEVLVSKCRERSVAGMDIATGSFGASMDVALVNEGPVTIILDSPIS